MFHGDLLGAELLFVHLVRYMLSVNSLTEINRFLTKQLLSNNTDPLVSLFLLATISFAEPLSHHPYFLYMFNFQHVTTSSDVSIFEIQKLVSGLQSQQRTVVPRTFELFP